MRLKFQLGGLYCRLAKNFSTLSLAINSRIHTHTHIHTSIYVRNTLNKNCSGIHGIHGGRKGLLTYICEKFSVRVSRPCVLRISRQIDGLLVLGVRTMQRNSKQYPIFNECITGKYALAPRTFESACDDISSSFSGSKRTERYMNFSCRSLISGVFMNVDPDLRICLFSIILTMTRLNPKCYCR